MLANEKPQSRSVHGVLVSMYGRGVLLLGESGTGKSVVAIELMDRGHRLVADDAVSIKEINGELFGTAADVTRGKISIPGLPLIDIIEVFSEGSFLKEVRIDLSIEFVTRLIADELGTADDDLHQTTILGASVPLLRIDASRSRPSPVLIEAAARTVFTEVGLGSERSALAENEVLSFHV